MGQGTWIYWLLIFKRENISVYNGVHREVDRTVRGQLATQADWGWPGPTVVGLASTVGLAMDGPTSTVGPGQLWALTSTDGLASPTKMKTFWVIKYLNIYSTNK